MTLFLWTLLHIFIINTAIGKYDEAFVYYKEALDTSRSRLGNTNPYTLSAINNMGVVLNAQG